MSAYKHLNLTMRRIANIVHNASQGDSTSKDNILDSLKSIVEDYNEALTDPADRIKVEDFRKR